MDGHDEVIDHNNYNNNYNNNENQKKDIEKDIEGDVEGGGTQQSIVRGKRTKRQKPQSPIPFRMIATTTNSGKSDQDSDICSNNNMIEDNTTTAVTATTTTTTITIDSDRGDTNIFNNIVTTKEEEEVAKCLILLAQSHPCPSQPIPIFSSGSGRSYNNNNNNNNSSNDNNNNNNNNGTKFISRKFMEAPSSTGNFGYYVYECKTCGKTFSSFQALGGHRASHKKPKYNKDEDYNNKSKSNQIYSNANSSRNTSRSNYNNFLLSSNDEDHSFKLARQDNNSNNNSTSLSLQLTNRSSYSNCITNHQSNNKRSRVHECSICGSEFTSGQALGGHMRRHRGLVTNTLPIAATPLTIEQPSNDVTQIPEDTMINTTITMAPPTNIKRSNSALSVDLDLNLPAPSEDNVVDDHQKESKSILQSNEQSPSTQQVVLSSSSIVDCDY
ncbi:unnamed protein product [Amaranthus hypochondriacus]